MAVDDQAQVSSRVLTVPNVLSFIRLLLVPVFFVLIITGQDFLALVVLVFSSLSDFVDGYVARRFGQITRLGQLLDPAADRLFIFAALVGLTISGILPLWFVCVIVARELTLAVVGIVLASHGYGPLPVHHLGKTGTFLLYYALPIVLIAAAFPVVESVAKPIGWAFAVWGAFLYWWAGFVYIRQTMRVIRIPVVEPATQSDTLDG